MVRRVTPAIRENKVEDWIDEGTSIEQGLV